MNKWVACEPYADFVAAGKPVYNAEYAEHYRLNEHGERDALCQSARAAGMRTLVSHVNWTIRCAWRVTEGLRNIPSRRAVR